jgi:CspA family cold shock protein
MAMGVVTSFDKENGYGFIESDQGETVFVHHTAIEMEGFRFLAPGDRVSFDILVGKRGPEAKHVNRIS